MQKICFISTNKKRFLSATAAAQGAEIHDEMSEPLIDIYNEGYVVSQLHCGLTPKNQ